MFYKLISRLFIIGYRGSKNSPFGNFIFLACVALSIVFAYSVVSSNVDNKNYIFVDENIRMPIYENDNNILVAAVPIREVDELKKKSRDLDTLKEFIERKNYVIQEKYDEGKLTTHQLKSDFDSLDAILLSSLDNNSSEFIESHKSERSFFWSYVSIMLALAYIVYSIMNINAKYKNVLKVIRSANGKNLSHGHSIK